MDRLSEVLREVPAGFIFVNLVDFDTVYGHRNDVAGYAANLERFDRRLSQLLPTLGDSDLLVVTADHGNDPSTPSTDHSREYVPLLITGGVRTEAGGQRPADREQVTLAHVRSGVDLGTRATFADLGQTLAANFGVTPLDHGTSFLGELVVQYP